MMQQTLLDRRIVLAILDSINAPTPRRLIVNRDGGPKLPAEVSDKLKKSCGIDLSKPMPGVSHELEQIDEDTIKVGGQIMKKPFVEKPVSGEDHNVYVYYHSSQGGGVRKLFRKVLSAYNPCLEL